MWALIHAGLCLVWGRRTTVIGYLTVMWSVLEMNPDVVGGWVTAPKRGIVLLLVGMVNAALGHFNASQLRKQDDQ